MKKEQVAILTDTNSGIDSELAEKLGVYSIPMPVIINGQTYFEGKDITKEEFFTRMANGDDISTSMPAPGDIIDFFTNLLEDYKEVVYIPMSSGLSSTCETATMLAKEFDGKVFVVDNQRISITLYQSVLDAVYLAKKGKTGSEIASILKEDGLNSSIYVSVDTLKYLLKGGRVTAAGAAIGTVLNIKPVLTIQGGKLDAFSKSRGMKKAMKKMLEAITADKENRFADQKTIIRLAYSGDDTVKEEWLKEALEYFQSDDMEIHFLPLSISTHVGEGALGVGICTPIEWNEKYN